MTFDDIEIPERFFSFGSTTGPQHDTLISATRNGFEYRTSNWRHARRQYDVVNQLVGEGDTAGTEADLQELQAFVIAREGSLNSFKVKDVSDFTTAADHVGAQAWDDYRIGTGDGVTTKFWIVKRYNSDPTDQGRYEVTRRLRLVSNVVSGINSTEQTITTHFTVDEDEGSITYLSAPTAGEGVFAGAEFRVEVRFKIDLDDWLRSSLEAFETASVSAPMIEVKQAEDLDHDRNVWNGGFAHLPTVGTLQMNFSQGFFHIVSPSTLMTIRLPDIRNGSSELGYVTVPAGGPYFTVFNNNATHPLAVQQLDENGLWVDLPELDINQFTARKFYINESQDWRSFG